ncbi:hypothetical protein [Paenibacillus albidus]|uniref:hypothetical protein n=1 Tax=Paenibacillus albidus TaxID=2041023 RepID=UPI001BE4FDDD|nr:hypothetical protein [Paenibacillus albidus]
MLVIVFAMKNPKITAVVLGEAGYGAVVLADVLAIALKLIAMLITIKLMANT